MRAKPPGLVGVTAFLVALGLTPVRSHADVVILPPHSIIEGRSIGEYTADAWRWIFSFSSPGDPLTDPTGAAANRDQSGPVFFVAGTAGGGAVRTFTVPADRYLLIPLLNAELSQLELGDFSLTEAQVRAEVNGLADLIDELHASIDGVPVPNLFDYREESPAFEYFAAPNNVIGVPTGDSGIAVADGYWLMLAPIPVGETHTINFGGAVTAFDFRIDVTSTITSVPEPSTLVMCGMGALIGCAHALRRRRTGRTHEAPAREHA